MKKRRIFFAGIAVLVLYAAAASQMKDSAAETTSGTSGAASSTQSVQLELSATIQQVVPLSDGGLAVVIGNRIIKYDSNLDRQKEVVVLPETATVQVIKRPDAATSKLMIQ